MIEILVVVYLSASAALVMSGILLGSGRASQQALQREIAIQSAADIAARLRVANSAAEVQCATSTEDCRNHLHSLVEVQHWLAQFSTTEDSGSEVVVLAGGKGDIVGLAADDSLVVSVVWQMPGNYAEGENLTQLWVLPR